MTNVTMIDDRRNSNIGKESFLVRLTHVQELAIHLQKLISAEDALFYCLNIQENVYQLKYKFNNQFINNRNHYR